MEETTATATKDAGINRWITVFIGGFFVAALGLAYNIGFGEGRESKQQAQGITLSDNGAGTVTGFKPSMFSFAQEKPDPTLDAVDLAELNREAHNAALLWSKALGRTVRVPSIVEGECNPGSAALGCAVISQYRIIVTYRSARSKATDPLSLMLHEIGHLLGVPHIQGDPLMNPSDNGIQRPAVEPSPAAIALAKLGLKILEE